MRAGVIEELGRPPAQREMPEPAQGVGETLVEVLATPLNPIDIAVGAGRFYRGHPPLPYVPGVEAVGRVAASERFEPGTVVWVYGDDFGVLANGGLAELAVAPSHSLIPVPDGASPVLAGALGVAGMAGWLPLAWRVPVRPGETVLVLGATGTVGLVAVQAAKLLGAGRVVAAGRNGEALERAGEAGADELVRLDGANVAATMREAAGGPGPSLVFDPVWGEPLVHALEAAAPGARIVSLGQAAGAEASLPSSLVRGKQLELHGYSNFAVPADVMHEEYRKLVGHGLAGTVRVEIEEVPLELASDAWRRQSQGPGRKLVVVPSS